MDKTKCTDCTRVINRDHDNYKTRVEDRDRNKGTDNTRTKQMFECCLDNGIDRGMETYQRDEKSHNCDL
jgi:hypothetical protein